MVSLSRASQLGIYQCLTVLIWHFARFVLSPLRGRTHCSPLPPGPHPGRGTRHAPARRSLPPRSGQAVCQDWPAAAGPRCAVHGYGDVSRHGDDVLAAAGGDRTGAGGGAIGPMIRSCHVYEGSRAVPALLPRHSLRYAVGVVQADECRGIVPLYGRQCVSHRASGGFHSPIM